MNTQAVLLAVIVATSLCVVSVWAIGPTPLVLDPRAKKPGILGKAKAAISGLLGGKKPTTATAKAPAKPVGGAVLKSGGGTRKGPGAIPGPNAAGNARVTANAAALAQNKPLPYPSGAPLTTPTVPGAKVLPIQTGATPSPLASSGRFVPSDRYEQSQSVKDQLAATARLQQKLGGVGGPGANAVIGMQKMINQLPKTTVVDPKKLSTPMNPENEFGRPVPEKQNEMAPRLQAQTDLNAIAAKEGWATGDMNGFVRDLKIASGAYRPPVTAPART